MDKIVKEYLQDVLDVLKNDLSTDLAAVWIAGSLATGDFDLESSDIDLIVAVHGSPSIVCKKRITEKLRHNQLFCPAHGLDLLVYTNPELRTIRQPIQFEFSIETGRDWVDEISFGGSYPGGIVDLDLLRQRGRVLFGPRPQKLIGPIHKNLIIYELQQSLVWHVDKIHDPFHDPTGANAVLNACRALHFLKNGTFVSKSAGAVWFLERGPSEVVATAAEGRSARRAAVLNGDKVRSFLEVVLDTFSKEMEKPREPFPGTN